ncbi:MAG: hypothetical protein H7329_08340 [Opitutaceae bacterium]|nr:hypothetical protein [Cytophagales bacterium]
MEHNFVPDIELEKKQEIAEKPTFQLDELYNYLDKYTSYFNSNYGFRNVLVNANAQINFWILNKSPLANKVLIGKEGWLFLSPSVDMIISEKMDYLDPGLFKIMKDSLLSKTRQFSKNGIKYYVMFTPEKSYSCREMLPEQYDPQRIKNRFDAFVQKLESNPELNIINVNDVINASRLASKDTLHFKYDSHWNELGAFPVYQHILETLKKDFPLIEVRNKKDYKQTAHNSNHGDVSDIINVGKYLYEKEYKLICVGRNSVIDESVFTPGCKESYEFRNVKNKDKPNILFLHDSFGLPFKPWLINDFHQVHSLWVIAYNFDVKMLSQLHPDVVVHELVPRNTPLFQMQLKSNLN